MATTSSSGRMPLRGTGSGRGGGGVGEGASGDAAWPNICTVVCALDRIVRMTERIWQCQRIYLIASRSLTCLEGGGLVDRCGDQRGSVEAVRSRGGETLELTACVFCVSARVSSSAWVGAWVGLGASVRACV